MTRLIEEMTWQDSQKTIPKAPFVFLPIGSTEQHGPHMPLGTDNFTAVEECKRCAELVDGLVLPCINYGQIWSHNDFYGDVWLSPNTLKQMVKEICIRLKDFGAQNIVLISGHGGNVGVLKEAARELYDEQDMHNIYYFCLYRCMEYSEDLRQSPVFNKSSFIHAEEIETSMMLSIRPDLIHLDRAVPSYPEVPVYYSCSAVKWSEFNKVGSFGDPRKATAENGRIILERMCRGIADKLLECVEAKRKEKLAEKE